MMCLQMGIGKPILKENFAHSFPFYHFSPISLGLFLFFLLDFLFSNYVFSLPK